MLLGGLLAGLGTLLRGMIDGGNDQWTYFLDTGGLLVVLFGAGLDFRASSRFASFDERGGRKRAVMQAAFGSLAALLACFVLGWLAGSDWPGVVRALISMMLTLGIGVGLAGFLYFGWFSGGNYLERRIEQQADEEW